MQAQHQSSGDSKANTSPAPDQAARHLTAIRIVGTAIFDYQVQKTVDARIRLESVAGMAQSLGDITPSEAAMIAQLLASKSNVEATV